MVFDLQSPHTPRQQILCGQVFSCGRFSPRSLARRSPGYEHRDSGRLQSRLEMALVMQGNADKKLLDTYNEERLENAKHLLQTTDRMFQLAAGSEWFLAFLRTNVLPYVAQYILSLDPVKKFIFPLLSQIGINYRHSSLSQHVGDEDFTVKAGDRMPYVLVDGKSIYDILRQPKFHWLVFSDTHGDVQALKTELASPYAGLVDLNII